MAVAPAHDERDREIAALKAEVQRLKRALEVKADLSDEPLFGHGIRGGLMGGLETVIGTFAVLILMVVVHHLTATQ